MIKKTNYHNTIDYRIIRNKMLVAILCFYIPHETRRTVVYYWQSFRYLRKAAILLNYLNFSSWCGLVLLLFIGCVNNITKIRLIFFIHTSYIAIQRLNILLPTTFIWSHTYEFISSCVELHKLTMGEEMQNI